MEFMDRTHDKINVLVVWFCEHPEKIYKKNIIRKRVYDPMYIDKDKFHIKLKEFDEMPLEI